LKCTTISRLSLPRNLCLLVFFQLNPGRNPSLTVSGDQPFRVQRFARLLSWARPSQQMSRKTTRVGEVDTRSNLRLLSLGMYSPTSHNECRITDWTDAGGAQAVSQLHVLCHVMERISRDANTCSGGTVKRPCEVFDAIGGTGTGG